MLTINDFFAPLAAQSNLPRRFTAIAPRILYVLHHAFPFSSNGYAARSHGVAKALVSSGVRVMAAVMPGMEQVSAAGREIDSLVHTIEGVEYFHSLEPPLSTPFERYIEATVRGLSDLIEVFKPWAVLGASNWRVGLCAALAAKAAELPFFYEVRGFWEVSQASRDPVFAGSAAFHEEVRRETQVTLAAQRVFTLNRFMRDELVRRGVPAARIDLVPNGFPGWPQRSEAPALTRESLGIRSRYVVGYVGSFNVYEGLEELLEAAARVYRRGVDLTVLLVGSGEPNGFDGGEGRACSASEALKHLAAKLGIDDRVVMPGRISPSEVAAYYSLIDVVVIPRRPFAVCELVSPMKPVEAAAHGKRVLLSDVAPLADLAELCPNFSYFKKGDVSSLTQELEKLLRTGEFDLPPCERLAKCTWEHNVAPIVDAVREACVAPRGRR